MTIAPRIEYRARRRRRVRRIIAESAICSAMVLMLVGACAVLAALLGGILNIF